MKGRLQNSIYDNGWIDHPLNMVTLADINLAKVDLFYHSNIVFGLDRNGLQKLMNYLQYEISPQIQPVGESSFSNDKICFDIICKVLFDDLKNNPVSHVIIRVVNTNLTHIYYTSEFPAKQINGLRELRGGIVLDVDTTGKITNCFFNTNLTAAEINKLNYYLQHVSNLATAESNGKKIMRQLNLKLNTAIDTQRNNLLVARYVLYNADSVKQTDVTNNDGPQIEAKFPGGQDAWRIYLERNLNPGVAANYHAPNGNYTVTVSFMVDENRQVSDVRADNDPGYGTAKEL